MKSELSSLISEQDLRNATPEQYARLKVLLGYGPDPKGEHQPEWDRCAVDICYWFDTYVWTYNPKLESGERWIKFILFPKQREYLAWKQARIEAHEDGLVEKSRDVGLTWLNIGFQVHRWLFEPDFKGGVGSATEAKLDRLGDPDTILEKGRLLLKRLPDWMLPRGFDERRSCGFLKFINPENGSTITGEAGDNIGRGGRNVVYDLDEAAFVEHADRVEAALSQNCDSVIWTSTVNGIGNNFYNKRFGGVCPVFIFDWRDDPRKTAAWYAGQIERFKHNPALMASEVDRDYTASVEGIIIPGKWVQAAVNAEGKIRGLQPIGATEAAADIAAGGANKTVFGSRTGPVVGNLQEWNEENTTINAFRLRDATRSAGAATLHYDANGIGIACKSTFDLEVGEDRKSTLGFKTHAILGGAAATESRWPDGKTSKELFHNYRAEIAWGLRERFRKTYEMVQGVAEHPLDELVSIPQHGELMAQLSIPLVRTTNMGKKLVESKEDMRKRGIASPDWFDMLMYLFAAPPVRRIIKVYTGVTYAPRETFTVPSHLPGGQPPLQDVRLGPNGGFIPRR